MQVVALPPHLKAALWGSKGDAGPVVWGCKEPVGTWPGQVGNLQLTVWVVCLVRTSLATYKTETKLLSHETILP